MKTSLAVLVLVFVNCVLKQTSYAQLTRPLSPPGTAKIVRINSSINKGFEGGQYSSAPEINVYEFAEHWNKTGYKSLGEMVDSVSPGCDVASPPFDVTGLTDMRFDSGFPPSQQGPCSASINGVEVFRDGNCASSFPTSPVTIPVDYSPCKGICTFVFYYVILISEPWRAWKFCIPISNGKAVVDNTPPNSPPAADTNGAVQPPDLGFNSAPASDEQGTVKP